MGNAYKRNCFFPSSGLPWGTAKTKQRRAQLAYLADCAVLNPCKGKTGNVLSFIPYHYNLMKSLGLVMQKPVVFYWEKLRALRAQHRIDGFQHHVSQCRLCQPSRQSPHHGLHRSLIHPSNETAISGELLIRQQRNSSPIDNLAAFANWLFLFSRFSCPCMCACCGSSSRAASQLAMKCPLCFLLQKCWPAIGIQ